MVRSFSLIALLGLAWTPVASAASVPPDVRAKFQQVATQSCNSDLDSGRFFKWDDMDSCVADKTRKLVKDYQSSQTASGAQSH